MSPGSSLKPRSVVWKFYPIPSNNTLPINIQCPSCATSMKFRGSTTGILNHLIKFHNEEYNSLVSKQKNSYESPVQSNENAQIELAKAFATGGIAFRFAENYEFKKFVQTKASDFRMPSRFKIRALIGELKENYTNNLKGKFKSLKKFTVITDGYSDIRRNYSFYSLHVAYIDDNFDRKLVFCSLQTVNRGDADSIGAALNEALEDIGLRFSQCTNITCDGGSSLTLLAQKQGTDRLLFFNLNN
uniref:BED-type domain-containing protein n=1 Tax=Caenorhabditis japonica TaxID=281687 RepID=A0A8R1I847_CAEJA